MSGYFASLQTEFSAKFGKIIEPTDIERFKETQRQRIAGCSPGLKPKFQDIFQKELDQSVSQEASLLMSHLQLATSKLEFLSQSQSDAMARSRSFE